MLEINLFIILINKFKLLLFTEFTKNLANPVFNHKLLLIIVNQYLWKNFAIVLNSFLL